MNDLPFWAQQLIYQLPTLAVYLLGGVLGLVFWKRCTGAALLTILGCGLMFVTSLGQAALQSVVVQQMRDGEIPAERSRQIMAVVSLASSVARAGGLTLVVIAVFAGRARGPRPAADEEV